MDGTLTLAIRFRGAHPRPLANYRVIGVEGRAPTLTVTSFQDGKWVKTSRRDLMSVMEEEDAVYVLLKLREIPTSSQPTKLHIIYGDQLAYCPVDERPDRQNVLLKFQPHFDVTTEVRAANQGVQTAVAPPANRYRPFRVVSASLRAPSSAREPYELMLFLGEVEPGGSALKNRASTSFRLEDERGQRYEAALRRSGLEHLTYFEHPPGQQSDGFKLPLALIHQSAGQLTLRADITVRHSWPAHLSIVVRNHDGTIPLGTLKWQIRQ